MEVKVPDIGDFKDVPIIEILVKPGESVKAEQSLVTLESDKATMDVPAPASGVVGEILAKIGDKVSMGVALLTLEEEGAAAPAPATPTPAPAAPAPVPASPPARAAGEGGPPPPHRSRSGGRAHPSCGRLPRRHRRPRRSPSRAGTRHRP